MILLLISTLFGIKIIQGTTMKGNTFHSIAHRGASLLEPEESSAAYLLAIKQGIKFIECDIVSTKDGVLILRHSPNLSESTDIDELEEFRKYESKVLMYDNDDAVVKKGIFSWDLTYGQIKKLKCIHEKRYGNRNQSLNGLYPILTLDDFLNLSFGNSTATGGDLLRIGIYIEIKYPYYHAVRGLGDITDKLLESLAKRGLTKRSDPVFIQSFEPSNLKYIRSKSDLSLVQLISNTDKVHFACPEVDNSTESGMKYHVYKLEEISKYADVVSPSKEGIIQSLGIPRLPINDLVNELQTHPVCKFIEDAHKFGLLVVPYTFRPESILKCFNSVKDEYLYFINILRVDGVFTDDPQGIVEFLNEKYLNF
ncbi:glycerophosphoryl diester phosphodiesterase family protein [Cryptosporidium andersoni]|uniref:glycerophosphodiester phosphodiesterase n=1 Tax=Cryptosporidium andersoni TaxID=117008 RepID=A0A1J4MU62_9CRYT|nr:glycerophosphoryl diester phosphodiesterase family protein [Cryptosporidium andersoni]